MPNKPTTRTAPQPGRGAPAAPSRTAPPTGRTQAPARASSAPAPRSPAPATPRAQPLQQRAPTQRSASVPAEPRGPRRDDPNEGSRGLPGRPIASGIIESSDMMSNVPDYMRDRAGQGAENIGSEDVGTPRLKLIQGTHTRELEQFDQLRAGDFFHTGYDHSFGPSVKVTPIYFEKKYILWRPLEDGGGILARSEDGINWSPCNVEHEVRLDKRYGGKVVRWYVPPRVADNNLAEWGSMNPEDTNSPPAATEMYNYLLGFPEHPDIEPAVFTFQRSARKIGRDFNRRVRRVATKMPSYGQIYELSSLVETNRGGQDYQGIQFVGLGFCTEELTNYFEDIYKAVRQAGIIIRDEGSLGEESSQYASTDSGGAGQVIEGAPAY